MILTDGTCGSACSFFESRLASDGGAVVVTYGGLVGSPLDTSSFGGGGVTSGWSTYAKTVRNASVVPLLPPLVTTAFVSFSSSEFYLPTEPLPREWLRLQGAFRLPVWPSAVVLQNPPRYLYTPVVLQVFAETPDLRTAPRSAPHSLRARASAASPPPPLPTCDPSRPDRRGNVTAPADEPTDLATWIDAGATPPPPATSRPGGSNQTIHVTSPPTPTSPSPTSDAAPQSAAFSTRRSAFLASPLRVLVAVAAVLAQRHA